MITLTTGGTLKGKAGTATAVTYTIYGDSKTTTNSYIVLGQGQLPSSTGDLLTTTPVPASTQYLIKEIALANATASPVTGIVLYVNGTAAANQITGTFSIPANGTASYNGTWTVYGSDGVALTTVGGAASGDLTGSYPNPTVAKINGTSMAGLATGLLKNTTGTGVPSIASSTTDYTIPGRLINTTAPITGGGDLSADRTLGLSGTTAQFNTALSDNDFATLAGAETLSGPKTLTGPKIDAIKDSNGNTALNILAATTPVNRLGVRNAATGGAPTFEATGSDTDVSIAFIPQGAGGLALYEGSSQTTASLAATGNATNVDLNLVSQAAGVVKANGTPVVLNTRTITATAPITIDATTSANLSANRTLAITAASTSAAGSMSALDKKKVDNLYIDVTANATALVLTSNTAAQNITAINAILSAAPSGSTIFFPPGEYSFNAAWTWPSKFFYILGQGQNRSGGDSELKWTSNVSGSLITLTDGFWYSRFTNITFSTTVDQTAGYAVQCGNNVGINFTNCSWQTAGGFFNSCIGYDSGANAGNSCFVDKCIVGGFKGTGIRVSSAGTSVVVSNTQVLGQWGGTGGTPASAMATAGISGGWVGALQINDCDVIGCVNDLLLNPVLASSEVCASVFCTNTYFDNSGGSCIKITGTGATVRCRFDTCSFTTAGTNFTTAGTALTAVEISSTFAYAAGGQGIDFVNCNALNTFATTGVTNGFLISGTADFSIGNCRVAGWTGGNGIQVTPIATAGRTQMQINNNTIGAAAGFAGNSVGILLNVGSAAYGSMAIVSNILEGNTTALTDNSAVAVGSQKVFYGNPGLIQKGALQLCSSAGAAVINARGAATASTTETFLFATKIPANGVSVGQTFRISVGAQESAAGNVTITVRAGPNGTIAGDTIIAATTAVAVALNGYIYYDALATVVALGATGNVAATGFGTSAALPGGKVAAAEVIANAPTTAAWYLVVSGTSSAGVTTVREGVIEGL